MPSKLAEAIHQAVQNPRNKPHSEACTCNSCVAVIDAELLPVRTLMASLYADRLSSGCPVCADELDAMKAMLETLNVQHRASRAQPSPTR